MKESNKTFNTMLIALNLAPVVMIGVGWMSSGATGVLKDLITMDVITFTITITIGITIALLKCRLFDKPISDNNSGVCDAD